MLRNARHSKILELIEEKEIETQEELCKELSAANFTVTQATVSRDIKELHLFKVKGVKKRFRYATISENENGITEKMRILFQTCLVEFRVANNLIVLKTLIGNAGNAGTIIDRLAYREVLGVVSGVDTVLIICDTTEGAQSVLKKLETIVRG